MHARTRLAAMVAAAVMVFSAVCAPLTSEAQTTGTTTVAGTVTDSGTGLSVSGATVTIFHGDTAAGTAVTDQNGSFRFPGEQPGFYHVEIRAQGFTSGRSDDVVAPPGESTVQLRVSLLRSSSSNSTTLREIGRVSSATRGSPALTTSSVITQSISPERLQRENYPRVAEALNALPGVNLRGQDSAIGDDIFVDIRGIKASETQVLIDGHPVGPQGVFGQAGGGQYSYNSYNMQLSPFFALRDVLVSYGSGGSSLYGTNTIGGSIDFQTLTPTRERQIVFQQGFGDQGKSLTSLQVTGTANKLGYAFVQGVQGAYGSFGGQRITQTGLLSQDQTSATVNSFNHQVSANFITRQTLAKLAFDFTPRTSLTLTGYQAGAYDDKTGNGDNDYSPYDLALYNAQAALANGGGNVPLTDGNGVVHTCPTGFAVQVDSGFACYSAQQYAGATSGPAGSQSGSRFQALTNWDYHARLRTEAGKNNFSVDSYIDRITQNTQRTTQIISSFVQSFGITAADDIVGEKNSFGFGIFHDQQRLYGDTGGGAPFTPRADLGQGTVNYFIRDAYTPGGKLSIFGNAWLKRSTVITGSRFDPRLSFVYRPTSSDVVRFTASRAEGFPSITLLRGSPLFSDRGAITNPVCGFNTVGSSPASKLDPESSKDLELTYGHRFRGDSLVQIAAYDSNVTNQILTGRFPITSLPGLAQDPNFLAQLNPTDGSAGYLGLINAKFPGCNATLANLAVSSSLNAASARFRGIELSGRYRPTGHLFFDYSYNIQSAVQYGIPTVQLQDDPTLIPGSQIYGTPLHKASLGIDYTNSHGLEMRLDGFYIGATNSLNRDAYKYYNGAITQQINKNLILNLGINNVFDQNTAPYGYIGHQRFIPENRYGTDQNSFDQANSGINGAEQFSIAPRTIFLTLSARVSGH